MPKAQQHLEQAELNQHLARKLCDGDDHYDWAITVSFYAALHYLEAYLIRKGHNVVQEAEDSDLGAHGLRRRKAKKLLPEAEAARYVKLQQQSESARYFPREARNQLPDIPARAYSKGMAMALFADLEQLRDHLLAQP